MSESKISMKQKKVEGTLMSQGLYITSTEPQSGKLVVVLGVMEILMGQAL